MKHGLEQDPDYVDNDIAAIEKEYLEASNRLAKIKKRVDVLEKQHWNLRRKLELAKGFPIQSKYDTIKCVGEELVLLYYRGELVIKHDLDELVEYYFKNMYTRVCPEVL